MSDPVVLSEVQGKVAIIRLNRPTVLNALNDELMLALSQCLLQYENDDNIGAMIVTGSDKAFAAGADIAAMKDASYMQMYKSNRFGRHWDIFEDIRKPVIAAVSGYALGGGCELAMMCDFIIASESARFGQPEIKLGVIPGLGGTQRLTRAIGKSKAMDLTLTGRLMDVNEAERSGLVARILPNDDFVQSVVKIAQEIAEKSLPSVMMNKEAVNVAFETTLQQGLLFERRMFYSLFSTDDQKEGMDAFINKRAASFKNS